MSFGVPPLLHGTFADVRPRASKALKAFAAGAPWRDAFESARAPVDSLEGLIVLDGPSPLLSGDVHIQLFLPFKLLVSAIVAGRVDAARQQALIAEDAEPWLTLGLLSPAARLLAIPPAHRRPLLDASLRQWAELEAAGPRFTVGANEGRTLWRVDTNLPYLLAQAGVPASALAAELPPEGPAGLLAAGARDA